MRRSCSFAIAISAFSTRGRCSPASSTTSERTGPLTGDRTGDEGRLVGDEAAVGDDVSVSAASATAAARSLRLPPLGLFAPEGPSGGATVGVVSSRFARLVRHRISAASAPACCSGADRVLLGARRRRIRLRSEPEQLEQLTRRWILWRVRRRGGSDGSGGGGGQMGRRWAIPEAFASATVTATVNHGRPSHTPTHGPS